MSTMAELSPAEQRAYDLITSREGVLQSELWKALNASSRQGSRLATSLAEKGLIERTATTHNGQRTYLLTPAEDSSATAPATDHEHRGNGSAADPAPALKPRDQRALALIQERGGIHQSEFWKELDVTSRTGSRIATTLEEAGVIRREEATYNGQQTYLLRPATKDLDFSLLMAGDMISPLIGSDGGDPIDSEEFTQWLLQLERGDR